MPGPMQTRQIGWALRIYRNSDNKVIALDDIAIVADTRRINPQQFHHSARKKYHRMLLHLGIGNREIAIIQMLGDYMEIDEASGDYEWAKWEATSDNENEVEITFNDLPKLGDTL